MLLRYRISILITLAILLVSASIVFVGSKREALFSEQYSQQLLSEQLSLWRKINGELVQRMRNSRFIVLENRRLAGAMEIGDAATVQSVGSELAEQLRGEGEVDRLDLVDENGSLIYSTSPSVFQSPIITPDVALTHIASDSEAEGIGHDEERNTSVVYGFPLHSLSGSGRVVGMALFATDILTPIIEMQRSANSQIIFVNRRGRLLSSNEDELWEELQGSIFLGKTGVAQNIRVGQKYYSANILPLVANLANLSGRLVIVKDVSDLVSGQQQVTLYSAIAIGTLIILLLVGFNYYMYQSFTPLANGVKMLSELSQGNLYARLELVTVNDEVGKISTAVNKFRANLVALSRFRRSRERRRVRQERLILREMARLVDTLDGEEYGRALGELEELQAKIHSSPENAEEQEELIGKFVVDQDQMQPKADSSIALMASAFGQMSNRIQDQNHRLREALQTKEALISLRKELDIATRVQLSLLPRDLDISVAFHAAGSMSPAKEVGGDFFDFFRLDENRIGVAIADVSGKGVPAAMFMIMARTLLRSTVYHLHSPAMVLKHMNNFLEKNNEEKLFITLFYGILDESTGALTYSTGGHNPPIVTDSSGTWTLDQTHGLVLGLISDIDYSEATTVLEPGSRIVMMTDGIPEAFNQKEEAFGDDRTLSTISSLPRGQAPVEDVQSIIQSVQVFVGDAPQFDDITCVVLRRSTRDA